MALLSRRKWALLAVPAIIGAVLAVTLTVAQAAPPASGTVVEGVSVPGADLGDSRAEVEASIGAPNYCQGPTQSFCSYNVSGVGQVNVRYRAADGSPDANGTPDDEAYNLRWSGFPDWETTAGVNTVNALADEDFVIAAYPNATVQYNQFGIYNVVDRDLGIEVIWVRNLYAGTLHIDMNIFFPTGTGTGGGGGEATATPTATATPSPAATPPPTATPAPQDETLYVSDIDMRTSRRDVEATVRVRDEGGSTLGGATVEATWTFPDGSTQSLSGVTNGSGRVTFEVDRSRGWHRIEITAVELAGYELDTATGDLEDALFVWR